MEKLRKRYNNDPIFHSFATLLAVTAIDSNISIEDVSELAIIFHKRAIIGSKTRVEQRLENRFLTDSVFKKTVISLVDAMSEYELTVEDIKEISEMAIHICGSEKIANEKYSRSLFS